LQTGGLAEAKSLNRGFRPPVTAARPELPPSAWRRLRQGAATFVTPGPRMVDELECAASVLLAIAFGHLAGAKNISWAAFSGYMVMRSHVSATLARGFLRIAGTGLGAMLAIWLTPLIVQDPALAALALAGVGGLTLYGSLTFRHSYAWLFVGLTFEMILLDQMRHPGEPLLAFAGSRSREVIAGTVACMLVSLASTLSLRRWWPATPPPLPQGLGWHSDAARHAAQAALALAALPFLGQAWREPDLAQAAVTIMAVMLVPVTSLGASGFAPVSRRILLRVAGCVAGAGLAAAFLFLAHAAPVASATAAVLIAGTVLGVALGRHIENGQTSLAYGGTQFVLAILVTLVPDSYADAHIGPALERLGGILVGILVLEPVLLAWRLVFGARRGDGQDRAEPGGI
jgi:uncharacterized membrane protein YccC